MPRSRLTLAVCCWLGPVVAVAVGAAADGDTAAAPLIVDRAIEHHGGDRYEHSRTELSLCSKSGCYRVVSRVDGGHFEYDVRGPYEPGETGVAERRVRSTNGALELWQNGEPQPIPVADEQRYRDWAMARVYFPFLPYRLRDTSVRLVDLGAEEWSGRSLHKVKVTFDAGSSTDSGDEYLYWFDPETARLEQFAYSYEGDPGGLRFRRGFNYRRVDGILFFDQENYGIEGEELAVDQLTPEFVEGLRLVSTVTIEGITVEDASAE